MGLFSDTCQALIDPKTGFALKGAELEQARNNPATPRCGNKVRKAARCCGKCGAGAPGGWWQCPSCQKWIGNESNFCWNCKKPQHVAARESMAGGVWQRAAGVFAERFEIPDIKRLLTDGLTIEQGTMAILLQGGAIKDVLSPGRHNLDSFAHKVNWFGDPPSRTVILVESGDVVLPLRVEALRSASEIPVEFYTEVALRFLPKQAAEFVDNLYKQRENLSYGEIEQILLGEIRYAVENVCNRSTIEDLVKDPQRRLDVEDQIRATFDKNLARYGLELVRLASAEFTGKEYEGLREKAGAVEIKRRDLEFTQRMRELLTSDKMQELSQSGKLDEYVAQMAQERGISDEKRGHELNRLKQGNRHESERAETSFKMAQEMAQVAQQIGVKLQFDDYTRDKLEKDALTGIKIKQIQTEADVQETNAWQRVAEEQDRIENRDIREKAEIFKNLDLQTRLAVLPVEMHASQLAFNEQELKKGLSAEQLLALEAGKNPELARALYEKERAKREDREKDWEERKELLKENADRNERIIKSALETTAEAAKHPGSSTQIVK